MALSANTVWEVRTAGNATNGGGFTAGGSGTDFSQQDAKNTVGNNISTTDVVAVGTAVLTSATAAWTSAIVDNVIYLQGGTGALAAGWYRVTIFTSSTSITVDRNVAAGTGITMNIGGARVDPALLIAQLVAGNTIHVKTGTYSRTSASTNVAGGCLSVNVLSYWYGYQVTRGDYGTPPVFQASGITTATLVDSVTVGSIFANIEVDGAGLTAIKGFNTSGGHQAIFYRCRGNNCTNNGFASMYGQAILCSATGCSTQPAFNVFGHIIDCVAYSNTVTGFGVSGAAAIFQRCISYANSGASSDGFNTNTAGIVHINCVAYGNGRSGFRSQGTGDSGGSYINCISEANAAYGFAAAFGSNTLPAYLINCAAYNNTSGAKQNTFVLDIGFITGSASFFTNPGSGDFSLNTNAGGGALARATGIPGVFPLGLTTGYLDIGAAQHADPVVSSGSAVAIFGG